MRVPSLIISLAMTMLTGVVLADSPAKTPRQSKLLYSHLQGEWVASKNASQLLGYADKDYRTESDVELPATVQFQWDERFGQQITVAEFESVKQTLKASFPTMKQRVVATGKVRWGFEPEDATIEGPCFLSHANGATYVLAREKWVLLYGGKVSVIQGADAKRDLLVIDFDSFKQNAGSASRSRATVVYERKNKPPIKK